MDGLLLKGLFLHLLHISKFILFSGLFLQLPLICSHFIANLTSSTLLRSFLFFFAHLLNLSLLFFPFFFCSQTISSTFFVHLSDCLHLHWNGWWVKLLEQTVDCFLFSLIWCLERIGFIRIKSCQSTSWNYDRWKASVMNDTKSILIRHELRWKNIPLFLGHPILHVWSFLLFLYGILPYLNLISKS